MSQIVIVGNGMAGGRIASELHARDRRAVTIFGAEPVPAYNRILLSQVIAGGLGEAEILFPAPATPEQKVHLGHTVLAVDRAARTIVVRAPGGEEVVGYDHLVLATGSRPILPPLAGLDPDRLPDRVAAFRDLTDCRRILAAAGAARSALVLGGGLLGLEAARGLAGRGIRVEVVHAVDRLMERQLDTGASAVLVQTLTRLGIVAHLDAAAVGVEVEDDRVTLRLADGRALAADLLVISCGVQPETRLARAAGLQVRRGVVVDHRLRTSDPHISAIGDCAELDGAVTGLVAPAWEQARVLARRLTGDLDARYTPVPEVVRLKAGEIDLAAMGTLDAGPEQLTFTDPTRGIYARLSIEDGRLAGAILLGDNPAVGLLIQLFDRGDPLPADRRSLLLGRSYGTPVAATGTESVALMPGSAIICQCNTVHKGDIVDRWHAGVRTVEEMVIATRVTTGCGTCREAVEGVIDWLNKEGTAHGGLMSGSNSNGDIEPQQLQRQLDRLDGELVDTVRKRIALSRRLGEVRARAGEPRFVQQYELLTLRRYLALGPGGSDLATLLLRLARSPVRSSR